MSKAAGSLTRCAVAVSILLLLSTVVLGDGILSPARVVSQSTAVQETPEPPMMPGLSERLAPPPMSDPPTQVEQGRYVYYLVCMVCHGDRGQGLTDEWRGVLDPADQNCWQSKCHAPNHPPQGFEFPRQVPPVIAPHRLEHHGTAANLYAYLRARMPWQSPGRLTDEEYWQLTAFLADANGASWSQETLGPHNAATVRLGNSMAQSVVEDRPSNPLPLMLLATSILLLGALAWRRWSRIDRRELTSEQPGNPGRH